MKTLKPLLAYLLFSAASAFPAQVSIYLSPSNGNYFAPAVGAQHFTGSGGYDATGWVFDDVTTLPGYAGQPIWASSVSVDNPTSSTIQISMFNGLWDSTGPGGGPGALLAIAATVPVDLTPGEHVFNVYTNNPIPGSRFWAGYAFSNFGTTATLADLNQMQFVYSDGATIGSSDPGFLESVSPGYLNVNNPATAPIAGVLAQQVEFYTPEPSTVGLALIGLLGMAGIRQRIGLLRRASQRT